MKFLFFLLIVILIVLSGQLFSCENKFLVISEIPFSAVQWTRSLEKNGGKDVFTDADERKYVKQLWADGDFKREMGEYIGSIKHFWALQRIITFTAFPLSAYESSGILFVSKKYVIPPVHAMRIILRQKYKDFNLNNIEMLNIRDRQQLKIAYENDDYTFPDGADQLKRATEFENEIAKYLTKKNIKFTTQEEIIQKVRNSPSTPDFVLQGPITWIDAKNFYAPDFPYIKQKIYKQAKKYLHYHGAGIMVFKQGCNSSYKLKNVRFMSWHDFQKLNLTLWKK